MLKVVFFDFDGTIADTYPMVIEVLRDIATEQGWPFPDEDTIESLRSMGVKEMFKTLDVPFTRLPFLFKETRSRLAERIDEVAPIPGMDDVLNKLVEQDIQRVILSSNTQDIIEGFLQSHSLPQFDGIHGYGRIFGKGRPLKKLVHEFNTDSETSVYVGDEIRDIEAAKHAGIPAVAVTWGFNTKELLTEHLPDHMTDTPKELSTLLKSL